MRFAARIRHLAWRLLVGLGLLDGTSLHAGPLKVFILAGQSNMEGHARIETFDHLADDPETAPLLRTMRGPDGKPAVCDGAWISYLTGDGDGNFELPGSLTAGFGSLWGRDRDKPGEKIGPEFTFGLAMDAAFPEPVLLIKVAWGGKSLHTDFRPPGAGPYVLNAFQKKLYYGPPGHGVPKDMDAWLAEKEKATGLCYRLMVDHVKSVLAEPKRVVPGYDASKGFELAGFIWLQGWNDLVDGHVYPDRGKPGRFDAYSGWLAQFIRDVRNDLGAPKLPFVIGVLGVDGAAANAETREFRKAMAAPAGLPEFQGTVAAVETATFWSEELGAIDRKRAEVRQMRHHLDSKHRDHANADGRMTEEQKREFMAKYEAERITQADLALWKRGASNAGYHYLGCAKTFARMGRAFADANLRLLGMPAFPFATIPALYTQRIEAHGYPIVASSKVNPYALKEAAHLVDLMLAKRPDVREAMIRSGSRLCLMAWNEFTTDLPEFARLAEQRVPAHPTVPAREYWDARARGLGGSETDPFCSCGEENLLGYPGDPYAAENILIHEFAHNLHLRGLVNVDPTFDTRLKSTYAAAMKAGLWKGKYASVNHHEYFAEGVQSWFDDNRENDHDHNHVNTRKELLEYDPGLAAICREVFGDTELKYTKPGTRLHGHLAGYDPSTAPTFQWPDRLRRAQQEIRAQAEARNQAANNAEGR